MFLKWSLCVLIIYLRLMSVRCAKTSSLTFVIDDTPSMADEIQQVKDAAVDITKLVTTEKATEIKDLVLVTFNDAINKKIDPNWPEVVLRVKTSDNDAFIRAIKAAQIIIGAANYDCPEESLTGLTKGLEESRLGSYVFVFTDADAKDHIKADNVINLSQKRQSQVIFIITYDYPCPDNNINSIGYQVYHKIAKASNGIVFRPAKNEVKHIMEAIKLLISGQKSVVTSQLVHSGGQWKPIMFAVDDQTEYVMISTSGINVDLVIKDDTNTFSVEHVMWQSSGKVVKFYAPRPNTYYAWVMAQMDVSIVVYSRTDFTFTHGFSALIPKSMDDTSKQPIKGKELFLSVMIEDPKNAVDVKIATILDMDDNIITADLTLNKLTNTGNHYITEKFVSPNKMFKIQVSGVNKNTGVKIQRFSKTNINPQDSPKPDSKAPTVSIAEGTAVDVEYDGEVTLTCKVSAYPEPLITWVSADGSEYKPPSALVEDPYEYISYLKISHLNKSNSYFCKARNTLQENQSKIIINVLSPFKKQTIPNDTTSAKFGKETQIICDVRSKLPVKVKWTLPSKLSEYNLSADNKVLTIKATGLNAQGQYSCETTLISDPTQTVTATTTLKITDIAAPEAHASMNTVIAMKGNSTIASCRITGAPKPLVSWEFKAENSSTFVALSTMTDDVVRFSNIGYDAAGTYKCTATNMLGSSSDTIKLSVHGMPQITIKRPFYSGFKGDHYLKIRCPTTGFPTPSLIWTQEEKPLKSGTKFEMNTNELTIKNPDEDDSGKYTCAAKNSYGTVTKDYQVIILAAPEVQADQKTITGIIGENTYISCRITGTPKPVISWEFKPKDSNMFVPLPLDDAYEILQLNNIGYDTEGTYSCKATNLLGSTSDTIELNFGVAPVAQADQKMVKVIKGENTNISCRINGTPVPDVSWEFKAKDSNTFVPVLLKDANEILQFTNAKYDAAGTYKCTATNSVGSSSDTIELIVYGKPEIQSKNIVYNGVKGDKILKIPCNVNGVPEPTVVWKQGGKLLSSGPKITMTKNELTIINPNEKDSSRFTCEAKNMYGIATQTFFAVIAANPEAQAVTKKITTMKGSNTNVPCGITSPFKPVITWEFKAKDSDTFVPLIFKDVNEIMQLTNTGYEAAGTYKCTATNSLGSTSNQFEVNVHGKPEIKFEKSIYRGVKGVKLIKIPCYVSGVPEPTVVWKQDGSLINTGPKFTIQKNELIIIEPSSFSSRFTCEATNLYGNIQQNFNVIIDNSDIKAR